MSAVSVEHLVVRHGDLVAVDDVSFTADAGEVLALLGPNGAGKTSTVEVLEGYAAPAAGRVRVLGHDPVAERDHVVGRDRRDAPGRRRLPGHPASGDAAPAGGDVRRPGRS